ncbi:MAG: putative aminohydrolase SsnA [Synergistetes bacterium]|nr:putative aminohydrolase SsnA [Synergistota bacterium]
MILSNAVIWTNDGSLVEKGWIRIEGGVISEVGKGIPFSSDLDLAGKLVLPGLVNIHSHLYSSLVRGMPISVSPQSFLGILKEIWWKLDLHLDEESVYYSALVGGIESLKSGITAIVDHHASYGCVRGSLLLLKRALVDELGMRADLCYEVSDRCGREKAEEAIEENLSFIELSLKEGNGYFKAHLGLHASFTLSDETLQACVGSAPESVGFHIHLAEGPEDQRDSIEKYDLKVVERLDRWGILRKNTIVVHGIDLSAGEKDILSSRDVFFAHCPQSNMNNGVGTADLSSMFDRGIKVCLGNDGYGFNILNDLRVAFLLQKHEKRDFNAVSLEEICNTFLKNNYEALESFWGGELKFGKIAPGYAADLIVLDYNPPTPLNADNFLGHLLFGIADSLKVDKVIVGGKVLLDSGKVLNVDEERVFSEAEKVAKRLWERVIENA